MTIPMYSQLIGEHVEEIIDRNFSSFVNNNRPGVSMLTRTPDFITNTHFVELKAGLFKFGHGPHVNCFQLYSHEAGNTIYAFAYHDKEGTRIASSKYKQQWAFKKYFLGGMKIVKLYFVSDALVARIYEKQKGKASKGSQRPHDLVMKEGLLRQVYENSLFKRKGFETNSAGHYGIRPELLVRKSLGKWSGNVGEVRLLLEQKDASFEQTIGCPP